MTPKVAIIYLCHGNLRHLPEAVSGLAGQEYPHDRLKVWMIPNASPDGIVEAIKKDVLPRSGKDLPEVVLHDDGMNWGFAKGNNVSTQLALDQGFDYIFLHNGDLKLHPRAIAELVELMEARPKAGSAQSMVMFWGDHGKVNTTGGMVHVAGYGFARDNGRQLSELNYENGSEVTYATGAAVLYRASALKKVGLLEEGFFMYHEDLELGLRLRLAGYENLLCTKSWVYHDYHFSRNPKKFAWMELYRWIVMLSLLRIPTIILLMPLWLAIELGSWLMALKGGWIQAKLWALGEWLKPRTWILLWRMRRRALLLRKISDRELLRLITGKIEGQETENPLMEKIINPTINFIWRGLYQLIRW